MCGEICQKLFLLGWWCWRRITWARLSFHWSFFRNREKQRQRGKRDSVIEAEIDGKMERQKGRWRQKHEREKWRWGGREKWRRGGGGCPARPPPPGAPAPAGSGSFPFLWDLCIHTRNAFYYLCWFEWINTLSRKDFYLEQLSNVFLIITWGNCPNLKNINYLRR